MPHVTIRGISGKRKTKLIELAVGFYCKLLMKPLMTSRLSYDIVIKKKLEEDAVGYCEIIGYDKRGRPDHFEIQLTKNCKSEDFFRYLAHEIVHSKQYAKKELNDSTDCWMKKRVPGNIDYWDQPWEIEAYGRELGMLIRFVEFYNLQKEVFGDHKQSETMR